MNAKRVWVLTALMVFALAGATGSLSAAEADGKVQQLVDQLRSLTDKARQQRAADRWLLNAMEDLVARYDWPWRDSLLEEDFSDGDFRKDPSWEVRSGEFWVDGQLGLRSRTRPVPQAKEEPQQQQPERKQDLGRALLGAFLEQALNDRRREQQEPQKQEPQSQPEDEAAEIQLPLKIPTVFHLETRFSLHSRPSIESRFEIGLFQDPGGRSGYRLVVTSGQQASLELLGHTNGRSFVIDRREIESLGDGNSHDLVWLRGPDGRMQVSIDGETLSDQRDNAFRYPFQRLALINRSGDLAVASFGLQGGR